MSYMNYKQWTGSSPLYDLIAFAQAELGLYCPLSVSVDTECMSTNRECNGY